MSFNIKENVLLLNQLASQVDASGVEVQNHLSSTKGRMGAWVSRKAGKMPGWAARHIEAHKRLEKAVNAIEAAGKRDEIPENVIRTLQESQQTVRQLAKKVNYFIFLRAIAPDSKIPYADSTKLLTPINPAARPSHMNLGEWELNFGLLYSAYQRASDEQTETAVRFLMVNYLAKAAFLNAATEVLLSDEATESYREMLQLGALTIQGVYHRTADLMTPMLPMLELTDTIGSFEEKGSSLIPLDTMQIQGLYNIAFITAPDITHADEIVDILVRQFDTCIEQFPGDNMEFPVLIDITEQIGQDLITNGDSSKIEEYKAKQQVVKGQVNEIIRRAADIIKAKYSEREGIQSKAADYLKTNTAVVSRAQISDRIAVLGLHSDMFGKEDFEVQAKKFDPHPHRVRDQFLSKKIKEWAGLSAVCMGGVNFRRVAAELYTDPATLSRLGSGQAVNYTVPGKTDIRMYSTAGDLMKTGVFKKFVAIAGEADGVQGSDGRLEVGEAQVLLAKATVRMIKTLVAKILDETWTRKQNDPAIRELTQTAVFRILQHLATAVHNVHDFRKFSQAIDRTHAELTTFLVLYSPFDESSFEDNYTEFLRPNFLGSMQPSMVGIAKSAMNVFAGINAAILQNSPHPVRVCAEHSYYEEVTLVGKSKALNEVLDSYEINKVDLYVGEFYHNIDIDKDHTNYQKGTVIQDVRDIFTRKPDTDQLTVAIDATIDFVQSEDIREFLLEFEQEIQEGKLNVVIFRSGQKFDMLGLDNYFGSPYYIVNNGDSKWGEFNRIKTEAVFQTDALSLQYFNWIVESGPHLVDDYKRKIFGNTASILAMVPDSLKPQSGKEVCVCTFEEGVKTPFIDIKIQLADEELGDELRRWAQQRFMELFASEGRLVYRRGSFGFAHPNITWIEPKMRINPGIDSSDNKIYQQFFNELEAKVKEIQESTV